MARSLRPIAGWMLRLRGALACLALSGLLALSGSAVPAHASTPRSLLGAQEAQPSPAQRGGARQGGGAQQGRGRGRARGEPVQSLDAGSVQIFYWPDDRRLAEAVIAPPGVLAPLPGLPADVMDGGRGVEVYLAPDARRFALLTGGRAPDWGAGVALPATGLIVLPAFDSPRGSTRDLPRVLRHELAHVGLARYLSPHRVPRWFSEGYATWAAGQLDPEAGWILRLAFLAGRAPLLDSLAIGWPAGEIDARVAYLLSASVIQYLAERGGDEVLGRFLERWRASGSMDDALVATYGLPLGQLERFWSRSVRRRYGWLVFAAQAAVIWSAVAVLVAALFVIRRRRDRLRLERLRGQDWREEEALRAVLESARSEGIPHGPGQPPP